MQIPILNGIYTDESSDFRVSYPRNLVPVPVNQGISTGYLRPADGIVAYEDLLPGVSRAGINWNDVCYRVAGTDLVKILSNGNVVNYGSVGASGWATMDYSFDYLGIVSGTNFFLFDGATLTQVSDPDLGNVIDHIWVDGYFMLTDGEFIIVTDLNDPFSVNPLRYGSSEADPDPIKALLKVKNEPYALNRYTTEIFDNVGGDGFPFQRIEGAQIQRGVVGTHACCVFMDNIAFVGGGRGEAISVWVAVSGSSVRIATREVDLILSKYSEATLAQILVEPRIEKGHRHLLIHLPNETLVYDAAASEIVGESVWFILGSGVGGLSTYRARNLVWCYDKFLVGDTSTFSHGYLSSDEANQWGVETGWEFGTLIIYNEGRGAIFHEIELVALTGRCELGVDSTITTQYSFDGETWSTPRTIRAGMQGNRLKRLVWLQQGHMQHWRIQRFSGTSDLKISLARLEARLEPLAV